MKTAALLITLMLSSGCLLKKEDSPSPEISRNGIIHGSLMKKGDAPTSFTVGLFFSTHTCSGVIIGKRSILTAAHCFHGAPAANYSVFYGNVISPEAKSLRPLSFLIHPRYKRKDPSTPDLALVFLEEDIPKGLRPIPLHGRVALKGMLPVESYGYSSFTKNGITDLFDYFRSATYPNERSGELEKWQRGLHGKLLLGIKANPRSILLHQHSGGLCYGDSGGPSVLTLNKTKVLIGINKGLNPSAGTECNQEAYAEAVAANLDWINGSMLEAVNETALVNRGPEQPAQDSDDLRCLNDYLEVFVKMREMSDEGRLQTCELKGQLQKKLEDALGPMGKNCTSPLADYYTVFLKNTLKKLSRNCSR